MATAMTTTTGAAAIGTVVTAAETRRTSNIANSAPAWIVLKLTRKVVPGMRKAANLPSSKMTETATIKTTTVGVIGTEVTAAARRMMANSKPNIARNASAWTQDRQVATNA